MMRTEHHHDPEWREPSWGNDSGGPRLPRFLAGGEDPTMWSVPLYRIGRLEVRAHWVWIVGLVLGAILTVPLNKVGPVHELTAIGWGIALVLLREHFRHLVAGPDGAGNTVAVLWDFGCMNLPGVEESPARPLWHALAGSFFNLLLVPITVALVVGAGGSRADLLFNPTDLPAVVGGLATPALAVAWWLYAMNLAILGANLLPMLPMDAARAAVVLLSNKQDREQAVLKVARGGLYVAGATLVAAVAVGSGKLAATALVGALVCWVQTSRSRLLGLDGAERASHADQDAEDEPWRSSDAFTEESPMSTSDRPRNASSRKPQPDATPAPAQDAEAKALDAVLEKISRQGMASLTADEKAVLEEATRRRRQAP